MAKQKFNTVPAKLVAAFDASGKEASELVVVAGFISSQEDWRSFDKEWRARLRADGLDYFHMVDFANFRKQFAVGWKEDETRRQKLFADLIGIIKGNVYRQFASAVEMRTFSTLSEEHKRVRPERLCPSGTELRRRCADLAGEGKLQTGDRLRLRRGR